MHASQRTFLSLMAFALLVLAAKFLLIAHFGNPTPEQDEWAEEGYYFMAPLVSGTLPPGAWFDSHYEHRQVMTRLLNLVLLKVNGDVWDPLLQMVVNAFLHIAALLVLLLPLYQLCPPRARRGLLVFATALCALPFNYDNTLCGYQSQVYFMLVFSFLFLRSLCFSTPFSSGWWLGIGAGTLAYFSFGGAVAALAAGAAVQLLRLHASGDSSGRSRLALAALILLCVVAIVCTPAAPATAQSPRADSPTTFMLAAWRINSWPLVLLAPLVQWPLIRFTLRQLRAPDNDPARWFVIAIGLWTFAMSLLLAYGRGRFALASRYTDYFAVNVLVNYLCLLLTARPDAEPAPAPGFRRIWAALVALGLILQGADQLAQLAGFSAPRWHSNEQHYAAYLKTGDFGYLTRNDFPQVPLSPSPGDMRLVLDDPAMRHILPPNLVPENAGREASWVRALIASLHDIAPLLLAGGMIMAFRTWSSRTANSDRSGQAVDPGLSHE